MKRWLAGLALVGLGLALWLFWNGAGRDGGRGAGRTEAEEGAPTAAPAELAAPPPLDSAQVIVEEPVAAREALATNSAAPAELSADVLARALVVEVVDPNGKPRAGIPLRLDPNQAIEPSTTDPGVLRSNADGRVIFTGMRVTLEHAPVAWVLRAELAFEEPPQLLLDGAVLAQPVVRFVLPPGAPLDVRVRELDGTPAPEGSSLRLQLVKPGEAHEPDLTGREWKETLVGGTLSFPWVELRREWELSAWRPKGAEPTRLRAGGPVALGQGLALELVLGSDHPVVSYRVLLPDGAPLATAELELARGSLFGSRDTSRLTTDADGRFTLDARVTFFEQGGFSVTYQPAGGVALMGRASSPDEPQDGWNDGGDIRLEPEPILCAGRVVDARGVGVAGAGVVVGEEQSWFGSGTVTGSCDAEGRFELRGLWLEETFKLHARSAGARSPHVEVRQGEADLVLVLTPVFALAGELLVDPFVDPNSIRFALEVLGGKRSSLERSNSGFLPEQSYSPTHFELGPVEGGTYDLLFLLEERELERIVGLNVQADTQLGAIDLRGRAHLCEIELVGAEDPTALTGDVSWWPSGSEQHHQVNIAGSLVRIVTPELPIEVELRPRGYRLARLENVRERREHRLEAPLRVRLVLRSPGSVPAPPYRFDAELFSGATCVSQPDGPRWFTPERDELACLVSTPGKLVARWHLEKKVEGEGFDGAIGSHVLEDDWVTLEVLDVPGVQVFTLELDGAALEGVVAEIGW